MDSVNITLEISLPSYCNSQQVYEKRYKKTKESFCPLIRNYCLLKIQFCSFLKKSTLWIWLKYHMLVLGQLDIFTVVSALKDIAKDLNLIPWSFLLDQLYSCLCTIFNPWISEDAQQENAELRMIFKKGSCMKYQEKRIGKKKNQTSNVSFLKYLLLLPTLSSMYLG